MNSMTVLLTSLHQRDFTINCIKSYLKFCPADFNMKIIVVENSEDVSYKEEVLAMGDNIEWFNNNTTHKGASALAHSVSFGMEHVKDEYVFLSHNDVCITSEKFFHCLKEKQEEGYQLIGTCYDTEPLRNHSIIILGCLVKSDIVRAVDLYPLDMPQPPHFECGDRIHLYCKENKIPWLCLDNTHNNEELRKSLPEPYKSLLHTVVAVDHHNNVIFLHFARGTIKTTNQYKKPGRLTLPQIIDFCEKNIFTSIKIEI